MTEEHFDRQMSRLLDVYGEKAYPDERVKIIFREVKSLSDAWFTKTVDKFIGEEKFAPLMKEFREEIAIEREKVYAVKKAQDRDDSIRAFRSIFDADGISAICKTISERVQGKVNDEMFDSFLNSIDKLTRSSTNERK